ncbi:hypothetical protein ANN_16574 [Periplaneta americana]|uniref:Catalase core domain-containing protein n=1 Tax=Periplaneta americana TaxID=6978 RepID=A0ABQ8SQR7_PERAM|nr:hypothetical protein ANN_16574 [Periplaneta americana]
MSVLSKDKDMIWDFFTKVPESVYRAMTLFSDIGIPDGYRHMNGYGLHTFKMVNESGNVVYVKFHFKTNQGLKNLMPEEAAKITATDQDYFTRDLYNAIANGDCPSWTMYIQVMSLEEANNFRWNPFDVTKEVKRRIAMAREVFNRKRIIFCDSGKRTKEEIRYGGAWTDRIRNEAVLERVGEERMMLKLINERKSYWLGHWLKRNCLLKDALEGIVNGRRLRCRRRYQIWPEDEYPLMEVGKLVLDRNPSNYFADAEQIAFAPAHMVPGIESSPDKVLQGRLFAYLESQRYRVGTNYLQLPVNCPFAHGVTNYERDGPMAYYNQGDAPNYYPNSFNGPKPDPWGAYSTFNVSGEAKRYDDSDDDNYSQPAMYWNSLSAEQQDRMVENILSSLKPALPSIQVRLELLCSNGIVTHWITQNKNKLCNIVQI